jgi:hypothetical protein
MKTFHLTIKFQDGKKVVAASSANAPGKEVDGAYSGKVSNTKGNLYARIVTKCEDWTFLCNPSEVDCQER